MFEIVLHQPEIPPNTGNVLRLCANTGCRLHLVEPLGFRITDKTLERAGLDYADISIATVHRDWPACLQTLRGRRIFALSTRNSRRYADVAFEPGDVFVFGSETRGLPDEVLEAFAPERRLRLPMRPANRSVNLSNSVAIVVYEAWRQLAFDGGA